MRQMVKIHKTGSVTILNIVEHIIIRNFWEYYITDDVFNDDIVRAFVMGDFSELGDISLSEIRPYIISKTKDLKSVMPAKGWMWIEDYNAQRESFLRKFDYITKQEIVDLFKGVTSPDVILDAEDLIKYEEQFGKAA